MWLKRRNREPEIKVDNPEILDEAITVGSKIIVKFINKDTWLECRIKALSTDRKTIKLDIENREPYYSFSLNNSNTWFEVKNLQISTFIEEPYIR